MSDHKPELPRRVYGTHLPAYAYDERHRRYIGRAKVPDSRWSSDEPAVRILLNGLRRWAVTEP
jgi:hypothetical protein